MATRYKIHYDGHEYRTEGEDIFKVIDQQKEPKLFPAKTASGHDVSILIIPGVPIAIETRPGVAETPRIATSF